MRDIDCYPQPQPRRTASVLSTITESVSMHTKRQATVYAQTAEKAEAARAVFDDVIRDGNVSLEQRFALSMRLAQEFDAEARYRFSH